MECNFGLKLNAKKTKVLTVNTEDKTIATADRTVLEAVDCLDCFNGTGPAGPEGSIALEGLAWDHQRVISGLVVSRAGRLIEINRNRIYF